MSHSPVNKYFAIVRWAHSMKHFYIYFINICWQPKRLTISNFKMAIREAKNFINMCSSMFIKAYPNNQFCRFYQAFLACLQGIIMNNQMMSQWRHKKGPDIVAVAQH